MINRVYGNGVIDTRTLDARYRPMRTALISPIGVSLSDVSYAEDANGNITNVTDSLDSRFSASYLYDDLNRVTASYTGPLATSTSITPNTILSQMESDPNAPLWVAAIYQYDSMGNPTYEAVGSRIQTFSYTGATSRLTKVRGLGSNVGNISYDAAGNETAVGQNTYQYSARNQLIQAQGPVYADYSIPSSLGLPAPIASSHIGTPWSYAYDGFGERLSTTINKVSPLTTAVASPLGGIVQTASLQRYALPDQSGHLSTESSTTVKGQSQYDYVWMGDMPVAQLDTVGFGVHFTFSNHLGAPTIQTDPNGNVTYQADYEPSGAIYDVRGSLNSHQPLRLPGQVAEQFEDGSNGATDLSYNGNRWYRPQWLRYTQSDPIGLSGGSNTYRYADDNPINDIDPSGLCKLELRVVPINEVGDLFFHADLVTTDIDQKHTKTVFTGGPAGGQSVGAIEMQPVIPFQRASGNMKPDSFGYVTVSKPRLWKDGDDDLYQRVLFAQDDKTCFCKSGIGTRLSAYWAKLANKNHVKTPYDPAYWNSNSLAWSALEDNGYNNAFTSFWLQNWVPGGFPGADLHLRE